MAVEPDREARAIMRDAQGEEFKHFYMDLEFLLRRTPLWREIAEGILFGEGDIVEQGEEAEEAAVVGAAARGAPVTGSTSLGIGNLSARSDQPRRRLRALSAARRESGRAPPRGWYRWALRARARPGDVYACPGNKRARWLPAPRPFTQHRRRPARLGSGNPGCRRREYA